MGASCSSRPLRRVFPVCRHSDPCRHLRLGCASDADRRIVRACRTITGELVSHHLRSFVGLATVLAALMTGMSLRLASSLRIVVDYLMTLIFCLWQFHGATLWPVPASAGSKAIVWLVLLASISGGIPLLIYFEGCVLHAHQQLAISK